MNTPVLTHDLQTVRKIVLGRLRDYRAKVWLFGSQATGKAHLYSDIDVAVLPLEKLPSRTLAEIREEIEESYVVRTVEIVDLGTTDETFRQRVEREGILWKG